MKFTVVLPPLDGEESDVGIVSAWKREIGDFVAEGETLALVRSGGQESAIPSPAFGILAKRYVLAGEAVEAGEPLALLSGVPVALATVRETIVPAGFAGPPRYLPPGPEEVVTLGAREQALARHYARSASETPHVYTTVQVDMGEVLGVCNRTKLLTSLTCVVAAVASALTRFPALNAQGVGEDQIRRKRYIHIGIARRGTAEALMVPVLRDADTKSVASLAREIATFDTLIEAGTLPPDAQRGATFTLAETAHGAVWQTPLLHYPQAAFLSLGATFRVPVALADDTLTVRPVMNLCLAHDARLVNGEEAAAFLADVKRELEEARFLFT